MQNYVLDVKDCDLLYFAVNNNGNIAFPFKSPIYDENKKRKKLFNILKEICFAILPTPLRWLIIPNMLKSKNKDTTAKQNYYAQNKNAFEQGQ